MENNRIKLNRNKSAKSINTNMYVSLDMESNVKLFPSDSMQRTIDKYEQYLKESDNSDKYRLTFTINPVCSNVIFNKITEVIRGEGSNYCCLATKYSDIMNTRFAEFKFGGLSITEKNNLLRCEYTTRDTTLSHPYLGISFSSNGYKLEGKYEHKCGIDIFNNHLLRKNEFIIVNRIDETTKSPDNRYFNTLYDLIRNPYGGLESGIIEGSAQASSETNRMHIYNLDNQYTFNKSIETNLKEVDGWIGFINQAQLKVTNVYNGNSGENGPLCLNRIICDRKECDFIDLYPDRTLYSFFPKWNSFRNRAEKNWEYCITYPYKNSYDCDLIRHQLIGTTKYVYGFKVTTDANIKLDNKKTNTVNYEAKDLLLKSHIRHDFHPGDQLLIDIVYSTATGESVLYGKAPIIVSSIGSGGYDTDHLFSINFSDISTQMINLLNINGVLKYHFRVRKFINGRACKYYMRIFKKLPTFKNMPYSSNTLFSDSDINNALKKNSYNTNLNKLGFAKNAYGDDLCQILFNDDIVSSGLRDNLGRKLSEVYLTIVKTNYGHEKWYRKKNPVYNTSDIEYSHCFGEITSGFDLPTYADKHNVHRLHNIPRSSSTYDAVNIFPISDTPIENDITIDGTITSGNRNYEFVGDIVELNENMSFETVLEPIYHRFNTAQRESISDLFSALTIDNIASDDFSGLNGFSMDTDINSMHCITDKGNKYFRANLSPEGSYYKPHYKIEIKEYSDVVHDGFHIGISFVDSGITSGDEYTMKTSQNYYLNVNNRLYVYDENAENKYIGTVLSVSGDDFTDIIIKIPGLSNVNLLEYKVFKPNPIMPNYAYDFDDGTGKYVWREFLSTIEIPTTSDLYNTTFTNGAHYIHENINFYLRRQDPFNEYGLSPGVDNYGVAFGDDYKACITSLYADKEIYGNDKDVSSGMYFEEGENNIC